jgi:hypothetical protein
MPEFELGHWARKNCLRLEYWFHYEIEAFDKATLPESGKAVALIL